MTKFTKNKKIILAVLIFIAILGFLFLNKENSTPQIVNNIEYENTFADKTSVYNFMEELRNEGKIDFKDKTYSGMGKLIEEINGIKNNGSQNWIYYVNGVEAQVGVSNYKINKGDIISWKYEKSY